MDYGFFSDVFTFHNHHNPMLAEKIIKCASQQLIMLAGEKPDVSASPCESDLRLVICHNYQLLTQVS